MEACAILNDDSVESVAELLQVNKQFILVNSIMRTA